jgi:hypothetical protein
MAFDFDQIFKAAISAGGAAAKPGGKQATNWLRQSAKANEDALRAIAEGVASGQISKDTGAMLLHENERALRSEAAALEVIVKASAQAGVNAFLASLFGALKSALKIAL